jgi:hypothetical protein
MRNVIAGFKDFISVERYFTGMLLLFVFSFVLLPSSKAVNNFYYIFMGLPALWVFFTKRCSPLRRTALLWLWVALLFWMLTQVWEVQKVQYVKHWFYVLVFCGLILSLVDPQVFKRRWVVLGFFFVVLVYTLLGALYLWYSGSYQLGERIGALPMRLKGPTYTSIVLVAFFALAAIELVKNGRWVTFAISVILVIFVTGYLLQSRAGMLGVLALVSLVVLRGLYCSRLRWQSILLLFTALMMAVSLWWLFDAIPAFNNMIQRADSGRYELWQAHFQIFLDCKTWLGCPPAAFEQITIFDGKMVIQHPHNILLAVLVYHGWIGFLIFMAALVLTFLTAWKQRNSWGFFLLITLLMLMFEGSGLISHPNELWLLIWLPCMLILSEQTMLPKSASK